MIKLRCTIDAHQVQAGLEALGKEAPRASMRAINRTLQSVNTQAVRGIAGDLGILQKHVRDTLRIYRANTNNLRGSLQGTGRRIPLIDFKARGPEPSRGRGAVTAISKGTRKPYPGAFIATMRSGHRGVFVRKGASVKKSRGAWGFNLPIKELFGPSVPYIFRKHIRAALKSFAGSELAKNLRHEIGYLLTFGKR